MARKSQIINTFSVTFILSFSILIFVISFNAHTLSFENKKMAFLNSISEIAEKFIGVPYEYGGDYRKSGVIDNSHLFYLIYDEAAKKAGLRWKGYMRMNELLNQSVEVKRVNLRNGDLVFLNNGHAAMVYKLKDYEHFNLIYCSLKRKQVITFHCQSVGFNVYWLNNLNGYYRPTEIFLEH